MSGWAWLLVGLGVLLARPLFMGLVAIIDEIRLLTGCHQWWCEIEGIQFVGSRKGAARMRCACGLLVIEHTEQWITPAS